MAVSSGLSYSLRPAPLCHRMCSLAEDTCAYVNINNTICIQSLLGDFLVALWVSIFSSAGVVGMACQRAAVKLQPGPLGFVRHTGFLIG